MKVLLVLAIAVSVALGSNDGPRSGVETGENPDPEKTAGLPAGWRTCYYHDEETGEGELMYPAEIKVDRNCRTHFCRSTGLITSSNNTRSCSSDPEEGTCMGTYGTKLKEGQPQNQTTIKRNRKYSSPVCRICVCINGQVECEKRDCCTYADADGTTVMMFPGQYYSDGCNRCSCGSKGGHGACTRRGCPGRCSFRNWDGVYGYTDIGRMDIPMLAMEKGTKKRCEQLCSCRSTKRGGATRCPGSCAKFMK